MGKNILLEKLSKDKLVCAEGFLFEIERRGYLKAGAFVPEVIIDNPKVLEELHQEFCDAGTDIVVAFTYYAHRDKLKTIDREKDIEKINCDALKIAKKVAKKNDKLMAGNICNTWVYDHQEHDKTSKIVREMYEEQVQWAKKHGADLIIAETLFYLNEALIALEVIQKAGLPSVVNLAAFYKKTLDGYDWDEACKIIKDNGADVVGLNCGRGPKTMIPLLKKIRNKVEGPIAALPVPYRTNLKEFTFQLLSDKDGVQAFPVNLDPFLLARREIEQFTKEAMDIGIDFIGLCCGNAPHYTRSIAETLGRTVYSSRYSPDMSLHAALGSGKVVKKHNRENSTPHWKKN